MCFHCIPALATRFQPLPCSYTPKPPRWASCPWTPLFWPPTHTPLPDGSSFKPLTQQACEALHETRTLPSSQSSLSLPVLLTHCPLPFLLTTPLLASCHLLVICTPSRIFFSSNSTSKAQLRFHLIHEIEQAFHWIWSWPTWVQSFALLILLGDLGQGESTFLSHFCICKGKLLY